jgi:putative endonuclease
MGPIKRHGKSIIIAAMPTGWVYMMTNRPRGTLYIGVTNDLVRRVAEHRDGTTAGFTKRYALKRLVYFENHATRPLAIVREKALKNWPRLDKIRVIVGMNPEWDDLYRSLF